MMSENTTNILIDVRHKMPQPQGAPTIVCDNNDYTITFQFDEHWDGYRTKTATFLWVENGVIKTHKAPFTNEAVAVPRLRATTQLLVGVQAGDIRTTTPARIPCRSSSDITQNDETEKLTQNEYDLIMEMVNSGMFDGVTPHIGENENWFLGETDTGRPSRGRPGDAAEANAAAERAATSAFEADQAAGAAQEAATKAEDDADRAGAAAEKAETKVESVYERNNRKAVSLWVGTMAEYEAIETKENNRLYLITDDPNNLEDICERLLALEMHHRIKVYADLGDLGFLALPVTLRALVDAMPNHSVLQFSVSPTIRNDGSLENMYVSDWGNDLCGLATVSRGQSQQEVTMQVVADSENEDGPLMACGYYDYDANKPYWYSTRDHLLKTYTSLKQMGISGFPVPLAYVLNKMPPNSMLQIDARHLTAGYEGYGDQAISDWNCPITNGVATIRKGENEHRVTMQVFYGSSTATGASMALGNYASSEGVVNWREI